ncbi:MAG TPA: cell shape determination protein CcmA [Peptococcaceae bacterium]|nr:MAG: hypothetical protein XD50_0362 [Clostridia bacterium 41_269]HBT19810.1 cell shape determination protein CcmA [Peptococcaceae bacterium]
MLSKGKKETSPDKIETLIGKDTQLEGTIHCKGSVRIDGNLKGKVCSKGDVIIGDSGCIEGDIKARNIIISGLVKGKVHAEGRVEFASTGKLLGDMTAKKLIIDEGAVFDGNCIMESKEVLDQNLDQSPGHSFNKKGK